MACPYKQYCHAAISIRADTQVRPYLASTGSAGAKRDKHLAEIDVKQAKSISYILNFKINNNMAKKTVNKSAKTGKFVSNEEIKKHPDTTFKETVKKPTAKKK